MEDIEETDDLLENEYLNDGFDDVDCDVDDLMKTKGRVHTGSEARTVDEDISKQKELEKAESMGVEREKEDAPLLDYSDFFADDTTSNDGEAVMQLKSVPVMKQDSRDEDYDTNIFPLPFSERRATASPQVDEVFRHSRSSNQDMKRAVSPIIKPKPVKMSTALSKKIATKSSKKTAGDAPEPSLPSIAKRKPRKSKSKDRGSPQLEDKSVSSARDAARARKLPQINRPAFKSKRKQDDLAHAKEKYLKVKQARADPGMEILYNKKQQDPVSPRINFKYDSRLGLFGFDIEAERQSKRENYELMRIAKKNEEIAELARARARVVHGAGVMDAKTLMPADFAFLKHKEKPKPKMKLAKPSRNAGKMRSRSDFGAESNSEPKIRSKSSGNNNKVIKNKNLHKAHIEEDILLKYKQNNLDAMQCSPVKSTGGKKKKSNVRMNPEVKITEVAGEDFFFSADVLEQDDVLVVGDDSNLDDQDKRTFQDDLRRRGSTPPPKKDGKKLSKAKVKVSPLKLSAIMRKQQAESVSYIESSEPSPRHNKPLPPSEGDIKNSFQRKPRQKSNKQSNHQAISKTSPTRSKKTSKSPRKSARKKSNSPRRPSEVSYSSRSPGKFSKKSQLDDAIIDSPCSDVTTTSDSMLSPGKVKRKKSTKKSIADELFEEFEAFSVNSSPSPKSRHQNEDSPVAVRTSADRHAVKISPIKSPRKSFSKGKGKVSDSASPRASATKKKNIKSPRRGQLADGPTSVDTSSSSITSLKKKSNMKKGSAGNVVNDDDPEYEDDYEEAYDDEEFDDIGSIEGDVLFDFSSKSPNNGINQSTYDEEKDSVINTARETAEAQVRKKEEERLVAKEQERKIKEEKKNALAKEEKRKAEALTRAREEKEKHRLKMENERLARERVQQEAEARRLAEEEKKAAQAKEEERIQKERNEYEQAERDKVAAKEKEVRDREIEAERLRMESQAKKDEAERMKHLEMVKEEKLDKAAKLDLEQPDENAFASPKSSNRGEECDDNYDDDYTFEDEHFEEVDVEATEPDSSNPVLFDLSNKSPSPAKKVTSSDTTGLPKDVVAPTSLNSKPSSITTSHPDHARNVDSVDEGVDYEEEYESDIHDDAANDDSNGDVMFDFNKLPSAKSSPMKSVTNSPNVRNETPSGQCVASPESGNSVNEKEHVEMGGDEEYVSDYDDDFD